MFSTKDIHLEFRRVTKSTLGPVLDREPKFDKKLYEPRPKKQQPKRGWDGRAPKVDKLAEVVKL
jgi:hypothetical protein